MTPRAEPLEARARQRIVRLWLMIVAAMIVAMVLVGGATRLTESGLSIVEWKVVTGTLPPLSERDWNEAFEAYKKIPQYAQMNAGMSLSDFKKIFWWEWAHRLLGRVIGFVFLLPFLFFLMRGWVAPRFRAQLWGIFALGALQGAVGWWMVASGLSARINVSQYRLAVHLTLALIIYGAIVWLITRMSDSHVSEPERREARERSLARSYRRARLSIIVMTAMVYVQLYLGALVAGLRAGYIYNTWPLIDGVLLPARERLWFETPWWRNLFENMLMVQFNHRMMAYALLAVALWHAYESWRHKQAQPLAAMILASVIVQIALGVATLLLIVPLGIALAHQAVALIVLTLCVFQVAQLSRAGRRSQ